MVLSQSAALHDVASRHVARAHHDLPSGSNAEAADDPRSVRRVAARVEPPDPLPVHHVLTPAAPATQRRRRRTRTVPPRVGDWPPCVAAPFHRTPAMLRPIPGLASTWCPSQRLNRLELGYKAGRSSPRASTEPPPSAMDATR
jgi:hypothetical protein